jgi:regulator of protease activity HflC (stomatin/prohibitin superfamily)
VGGLTILGEDMPVVVLVTLLAGVRIVKQYELGVLFRLGRVLGIKEPGLRIIVPFVDMLPGSPCASSPCPSSPKASSAGTT